MSIEVSMPTPTKAGEDDFQPAITVREVLDRIAWMEWDEKLAVLQETLSYVGEQFAREMLNSAHPPARSPRFSKPGWKRTKDGFWMHLDPAQFVDREIVRNGGVWEPGLRAVLRACLRPGDAFIDIGAHKGFLTGVAAQLVRRSGIVISVDPDPRAFAALSENVRRNSFSQVKLEQIALGAQEGSILLAVTATLGNTSSFPNRIAIQDVVETIEVPCTTLDQLLSRVPLGNRALPLIKIDVEGAEPLVWKGMQEVIERYCPMFALEINYASLHAAGFKISEFSYQMQQSGYTSFYEYDENGRLTPTDIERERDLLVDVLAVPRRGHDRFAGLTVGR
jgi:FkbM family methyltransferase